LRHLYTDHLGTPRLVTDASGNQVAYHAYYPFGEEATNPVQDEERMKFTGHERDFADVSDTADDLDYMHARFCSPLTARFMTVDPIKSADLKRPQSWNQYVYSRNNPLTFVDPTGEIVAPAFVHATLERNAKFRERFAEVLGILPGGDVLARVADLLLGTIAPVNAAEANAALLGMVAPLGGKAAAGRVSSEAATDAVTTASKGVRSSFPTAEDQVRHIFREAPGHLADTTVNRTLLRDVAEDAATTLGTDRFGNVWSARTLEDGSQVWVQMRNGVIQNGGVNTTPRVFNPETGLSGGS